jgi:hypothetical protein
MIVFSSFNNTNLSHSMFADCVCIKAGSGAAWRS